MAWRRQGRTAGQLAGTLGLLLTLAGCTNNLRSSPDDPLLGAARPPVAATGGAAGTTPLAQVKPATVPAAGTVPPIPSWQPPTSMAALAAGNVNPPNPNTDLRIPAANPALTGQVRATGAGGVVLDQPRQLADNAPRPTVGVPVPAATGGFATPPPSPPPGPTREDIEAQLKRLGAIWTRLDGHFDQGKYTYSCRIPDPKNKDNLKVVEATAADPMAAMQAVLAKVRASQ